MFGSIDLPLRSHSRIEHSPERIDRSENHPAHGYCEVNTPAETIAGPNREHASVHAHAANMGILPNHDGGERRREKVKKFAAEKGPRIAGAAAAIGMFIFNVVTSCS